MKTNDFIVVFQFYNNGMLSTIRNTNICLEVISKHVTSTFNPTCLTRPSCTECFRTTMVERVCVIDGPIHSKGCCQIQCTEMFYSVL